MVVDPREHAAVQKDARSHRPRPWVVPRLVDVAIFALILIVALPRLPEPLFGDQSLNMLIGRVIAAGGRPYADAWDLKHPGIFFFFATAGVLCGFHELGVHLFELFWMLSLAILIRVVAAGYVRSPIIASFAPAFTVGSYYALTTGYHLTQTEAVIGLPLFVSLITTIRAVQPDCRRPRLFLLVSGISAGVVLVFKVPYVLLPVLFWFCTWLFSQDDADARPTPLWTIAAPSLAGLLLPLFLTIAYLGLKSELGLVWWTFVEHPREAATRGGVFAGRFRDSLVWFARTFRVPLILLVTAVWSSRRRRWDLMTIGLVTWLAAGVLVIWAQVISWWPYHYLSLMVPVGLLATRGLEVLWTQASGSGMPARRRTLAAALMCLCAVLYGRQVISLPGQISAAFRARPLPVDGESLRARNAGRFPDYAQALATTAFLREPGSHAGPIFVVGHPNLYNFSGRLPAIRMVVWGTAPPAGTWPQLIEDLRKAAPPYVFVGHEAAGIVLDFDGSVPAHLSVLRAMLEQRYRLCRVDAAGTWYIRADLRPALSGLELRPDDQERRWPIFRSSFRRVPDWGSGTHAPAAESGGEFCQPRAGCLAQADRDLGGPGRPQLVRQPHQLELSPTVHRGARGRARLVYDRLQVRVSVWRNPCATCRSSRC